MSAGCLDQSGVKKSETKAPPNCLPICFTDGQAIAKRLCSQISKTTNAVKQLVKEYAPSQTSVGSKYPSKVLVKDALDINSSMWLSIDSEVQLPSSVPYCVKRQLIDLTHINNRCKEEMEQIVKFYEGKL